jgi:hypothetical protein
MADPPFPLTRETHIRVDRDGVFWNEGQRIGHPGLQRAFARWLDVDDESGRYILRNAINWAFIAVEDAPLLIRGVESTPDTIRIAISDDSWEDLDVASLRVEAAPDGGVIPYCDVRQGRIPARFTPNAAFALLALCETPEDDLVLRGHAVRRVSPGEGGRRTISAPP